MSLVVGENKEGCANKGVEGMEWEQICCDQHDSFKRRENQNLGVKFGSQFPGGFMTDESFKKARKSVVRKHKSSIVKSAFNGYKRVGRGLVFLELSGSGGMEHLSYLTPDKLMHRKDITHLNDRGSRVMLMDKISSYSPSSEVLVMVTDGEYERFLVGSKQATH